MNKFNLAVKIAEMLEEVDPTVASEAMRIVMIEKINEANQQENSILARLSMVGEVKH